MSNNIRLKLSPELSLTWWWWFSLTFNAALVPFKALHLKLWWFLLIRVWKWSLWASWALDCFNPEAWCGYMSRCFIFCLAFKLGSSHVWGIRIRTAFSQLPSQEAHIHIHNTCLLLRYKQLDLFSILILDRQAHGQTPLWKYNHFYTTQHNRNLKS